MAQPESLSTADLDLIDESGRTIAVLRIVTASTVSSSVDPLILVDAKDANKWREQRLQLLEGRTYDYALTGHPAHTHLRPGIFRASRLSDSSTERGAVVPEANTGLLPVILEREDGQPIARAALEVRSSKLNYREHYRRMLDYIADQATDLLMEVRAPAMLRLAPEPGRDASTIAQQFAFLRGILGGTDFRDALSRILSSPHTKTIRDEREQDLRRGIVPSASVVRQLAMRQPRFELPFNHPIAARLRSVPTRVRTHFRRETPDTPENRFVKYVLSQFVVFLSAMERRIGASLRQEDKRLSTEIGHLRAKLGESLSRTIFADVSEPAYLPLGSPVLQRRGGYREVLQAWLSFNLAARLTWEGGNDVYASGKRNVAALYEYWLFFRLLDLFSKKFQFPLSSRLKLIEKTSDGFGLKLKSGRHMPILGEFSKYGRRLNVKFSYNRTFVREGSGNVDANYPAGGSWTRRMRPDYTLSIWPFDFSEDVAEVNELMVHLHFDAKYRVDTINELFGNDSDEDLDEADAARSVGRSAKRDDLLKMHAYKDAIRRSSGAYVLYPGTETSRWREYHELLPNLGAFAIRPDGGDDGTSALSSFIDDVMKHLCDRTSLREHQSYHVQAVQSSPLSTPIYYNFPERAENGERVLPLRQQYALAVWCGTGGLPIMEGVAYMRLPDGIGLDGRLMNVTYILAYGDHLSALPGLRITVAGPRLLSSEDIRKALDAIGNFQSVPEGVFLAYDLGGEFMMERIWNPEMLKNMGIIENPLLPIFVKIENLFSDDDSGTP